MIEKIALTVASLRTSLMSCSVQWPQFLQALDSAETPFMPLCLHLYIFPFTPLRPVADPHHGCLSPVPGSQSRLRGSASCSTSLDPPFWTCWIAPSSPPFPTSSAPRGPGHAKRRRNERGIAPRRGDRTRQEPPRGRGRKRDRPVSKRRVLDWALVPTSFLLLLVSFLCPRG